MRTTIWNTMKMATKYGTGQWLKARLLHFVLSYEHKL